jgi:hypothetical protein
MMRLVSALVLVLALCAAGCGESGSNGSTVEADLGVAPTDGTVITDFILDASGSSTGTRALEFRWDWNGDGTWDTDWSTDAIVTHRFAEGGTLSVYVQVTDGSDASTAVASVVVDGRHGYTEDLFGLPSSANPKDLAYDGANIWVTNWAQETYKLDAVTGDSLGTIHGNSAWTGGIAWDGAYLWTVGYSGGMQLFKQDPASGDVLGSFPIVYSAHASGLAWDGSVFYCGSSANDREGDGQIHVYTPDGTHMSSFPSPRGSLSPWGVAFDGVNAWVVIDGSDSLYVVDPTDGAVLRVVDAPGRTGGVEIVDDHVLVILGGDPARLARVTP